MPSLSEIKRHSTTLACRGEPVCRPGGSKPALSLTSIRHGPDCLIALMVFVAFPRAAANVQIRVRGSRKHHPSTFVATVVGRPFAAASKGHVIIQCGPMGIAGLVLSAGSVLLL